MIVALNSMVLQVTFYSYVNFVLERDKLQCISTPITLLASANDDEQDRKPEKHGTCPRDVTRESGLSSKNCPGGKLQIANFSVYLNFLAQGAAIFIVFQYSVTWAYCHSRSVRL